MSCATGIIKYSLFILNILWALLGILAILFAGFGWGAMPKLYAITIAAFGGVILLISFFGCCGTLRESPRLLWTYGTFLFIILLLTVAFICLSSENVFKRYALDDVERQWKEEEMGNIGALDNIQITYKCCGRESVEDYVYLERLVPLSCCENKNCFNPLNIYKSGCLQKVEEAFADEPKTTQYVQWGLLSFDILILIFTIMLAIHYMNRKRRFSY